MTSTPQAILRIGTRGSPLALAQAEEARRRLREAHAGLVDAELEIVVIRTTGDRIQDRALAEAGGKGLFTKELEEALFDGRIDLAVHSMKDVPTFLPAGLSVAAILPREDVRDALIAPGVAAIGALAPGARVGTASLRRQAQLLHRRPDLQVATLRGNVQTRLARLAEGRFDATLLALAGLRRLGLADRASAVIPTEEMLPAVAQGAIGLECREADARTRRLLAPLAHRESEVCVAAERALLAALDGSCRTPIAALAEILPDGRLRLRAEILRPDGSEVVACERAGPADAGVAMGRDAGDELKRRGGAGFFAAT
ncbi:MAG: hydroxymethylbilane synthase [Alphaproteobacteria bacterium]|nr:hydroxymethylbilane synthase [Alphaproteobacteria bacterium]